ncbi:MAG TPA: radical SAM protein [Candidatus Pacearchaeota archaeon]|nr:radical SAM protein [Candidatus Pacearchaeota archaeon]HOL90472.1 radical SAM protein [Candidatus Pacearchaeota archaeon]HPO68156.1 radical SAM protein [Candidatus Pacearchaeota archaeon]
MKILHVYPKQTGTRPIHITIPKRYTYFWEIASFLGNQKNIKLKSIDCLDHQFSIFDLCKIILKENFSIIILLVRVENISQTIRFAEFLKTIDDNKKIIIYGDIVNFIPDFFKNFDCFDAIVTSGDWELSLLNYINYIKDKSIQPSGVYIKKINQEFKGEFLFNNWKFTDIKNAPINFYNNLNRKKELTITVARGCPFNCRYCFASCTFGLHERRKNTTEICDFIERNKDNFTSFKFFAPTFNSDNEWVLKLCKEIIKRKIKTSWCVTSRVDLLTDESLISAMAKAGCYKISVGLETINKSSIYIKKQFSKEQIVTVAKYCNKYKVILKGLIMLGIPYQTKDDIFELFSLMKKNNIVIRPTSYSPFDEIKNKKNIDITDIQKMDKFTYYKYGIKGLTKKQYFQLIVDPDNFENILKQRI